MILTTKQLGQLMGDIQAQPDWRTPANKACAYYDGEQLAPEVKQALKAANQPELVYNLIKPTINGVLGLEARTRTDMMITADNQDDELEELLEGVNETFKDTRRLCDADIAESDAYAALIKAGLGWVEIYRNPYPMQNPYKIQYVHRDEVFYDFNSKQRDLSDCRWILRRKWLDVDEAKALVPDKKDLIDRSIYNDWAAHIGDANVETIDGIDSEYKAAWADYENFGRKQSEWLQTDRKRILMQTVYYAVIEMKDLMIFETGRIEEYDHNNKMHNMLVAANRVELTRAPVRYIREAWFIGSVKCRDKLCDAPQGQFPLVPFWGYRKDSNNMPYGMISDMITPQDAVNFRYIKLTAQLNYKSIVMDSDATNMTREQVQQEVHKSNGIVELNPDRRNKNTIAEVFQVNTDTGIAGQQFQLAKDSQEMIQQCGGVYNAMLGQGQAGQSGVAINNLIEQGSTTLSEINDNYRFGRLQLNRLLMLYMFEDLKKRKNVKVTIKKDDPTKRKLIVLNETNAAGKLNNDVTKIRAQVALAPIQQTPTYKAQMAQQLTLIAGSLPPEVQMATIDMVLQLMDIPNKHEFLGRVRSAMGIKKDFDKMTPEEQQQAQAEAQAQSEQQQLMMRKLVAEVMREEAEAQAKQTAAQAKAREIQSADAKDAKLQAETAKIVTEVQSMDEQVLLRNVGTIERMTQAFDQIAI